MLLLRSTAHDPFVPPMPIGTEDCARWTETRRRRRLLSGRWEQDLETVLLAHFGRVRRPVMGRRSLARNPFRALCHELACNYDEAPRVRNVAAGEVPAFLGRDGVLKRIGFWAMMRRVQVDLIGLREMLLRVDWSPEIGQLVVRPITPDCVVAAAFQSAPDVPVEIRELRWRQVKGRGVWAWDVLSIADPEAPHFRVIEATFDGDGTDITEAVLGQRYEGAAYPYRWTQGTRKGKPFLPYALYHAMRRGLWDYREGQEVVEGTLDAAANYTFVQHAIFRASWPQRWALNAYVAGTAPTDTATGPRTEVPSDPTSVVHFIAGDGATPPQIGQWGPGADPLQLAQTVALIERAVSNFDGLDASDTVLRTSSDPVSAVALTVSREGKRRAQRRYTPELQPSDTYVLEMMACVLNLVGATPEPLPESDYEIGYRSLPLAPDEAQEIRERNATLIAQGRLSIVDAFMDEHPGCTRDEAITELERIGEDNKRFGVAAGTSPTPLVVNPGGSGTTNAAAAA